MFGVFGKRTRTPIFHPSFSGAVLVNLSVFGAQSVEKIYVGGILFMKVSAHSRVSFSRNKASLCSIDFLFKLRCD